MIANIQTFIQGQEGRVGIQVFSEQSRLKDTSTSAIRTLTQQMWNKTLDKDLKRIKDLKNHSCDYSIEGSFFDAPLSTAVSSRYHNVYQQQFAGKVHYSTTAKSLV